MVQKNYDLKERTFKFAQKIIETVEQFPKKVSYEIVGRQLTRSGTSIGANVEEADGAVTKKDFVNKIAIARKEAKETSYWLRLMINRDTEIGEIIPLIKECHELVCILSTIINKSR